MVKAEPESKGRLHVAADVSGRHEEGDARFHGDAHRRRIEWGGTASGYGGWLQVEPDGEGRRSRVTIHLTTTTDHESDEVERAIDETLRNIKSELRAG